MKKSVMKKWVAALRSGEYKQCYHQLQDTNGFCCLGVLIDLYIAEKGFEAFNFSSMQVNDDGTLKGMFLPGAVQNWAGMLYGNGSLSDDDISLVTLNDRRTPFSEIADIIEARYKEL